MTMVFELFDAIIDLFSVQTFQKIQALSEGAASGELWTLLQRHAASKAQEEVLEAERGPSNGERVKRISWFIGERAKKTGKSRRKQIPKSCV